MKIKDVVHGNLTIPDDIGRIIMTKPFQRLKKIKQLGFLCLCIPNARNTRFEHCIGTYWLTCRMLNGLKKNTAWLSDDCDFSIFYAKAVEIAALLHDVGHGPFSHAWEHLVNNFNHEINGNACVDAVFEELDETVLPQLRANNNFGVKLIKALIIGDKTKLPSPIPGKYNFIFEIVNNKQCNVDVDKWDYLVRDRFYLATLCNPNVDFESVFLNARAAADGSHIEYLYDDYEKIYEIFKTRWLMHKHAYHLPENLAIETLMKRILKRTNCKFQGYKMNEINAATAMSVFLQLTDDKLIELIQNDQDYIYIEDAWRLKRIDDITDVELDSVLIIDDFIQGPGIEMPPDSKFHFYGNKSRKGIVQRITTPTQNRYIFRIG